MKSGISSLLLISYEYFNITTSPVKSHAMLGGFVDDKLDKLHPKSKGSANYHFQPIILFTLYLLSKVVVYLFPHSNTNVSPAQFSALLFQFVFKCWAFLAKSVLKFGIKHIDECQISTLKS